jgi:CubicO group peptidase (beta-lactamase class C family)
LRKSNYFYSPAILTGSHNIIPMKLFCSVILTLLHISAFAQLSQQLDSFFRCQPADKPGFALLIEKKGELIYRNFAGLANDSTGEKIDAATNFRLASLTKQFTAMGILLLEKDHLLSFEDSIGRYLPELPARIGNHVRIRHLLTHSSGIPDYESLIPPGQTDQVLDADVLHLLEKQDSTYFPPGTQFRYSNSGFCLLALIIERVAHQSFASFISAHIFIPLHMYGSTIYEAGHPIQHRAMGYAKDSSGHIYFSDQSVTSATKGDGGVYTSLDDYTKWIRALQENKLVKLPAILKQLRFPIDPDKKDGRKNFYAAGWFYIGSAPVVLFHSGSTCGFSTYIIQIPGDEWSITYFSNLAENASPFADILKILKQNGEADFSQVFGLQDLTR